MTALTVHPCIADTKPDNFDYFSVSLLCITESQFHICTGIGLLRNQTILRINKV
jgi:hypothetical protein